MHSSIDTGLRPLQGKSRRVLALPLRRWVIYAGINLFVVSLLGVLLRYKGVFGLPALDYNYILHAHSHFAFSGWVTTALFAALLFMLEGSGVRPSRVYRYQFWLNQFSSFGMLVSFMVQGYGPVSIVFSSLSVVFSYWFAWCYWRDAKSVLPPEVRLAIGFALLYLVLSSLGPYLLAYSMAHRVGDRAFYYNAIYLYLHFQYNGWFTFGVLALFLWWAFGAGGGGARGREGRGSGFEGEPGRGRPARVFVSLLGFACIPAYCLSLLWTDPPLWIRITAVIAALLQLAGGMALLILLLRKLRNGGVPLPMAVKTLWSLSLAAFGIKLLLQALSVTPTLGDIAFGHRSVIIAYLHLVLLGFVTLSLLGFFVSQQLLSGSTGSAKAGLILFTGGVLFNELVLLLQSLMQIDSIVWTDAGYWLFGAAVVLGTGALLLVTAQRQAQKKSVGSFVE